MKKVYFSTEQCAIFECVARAFFIANPENATIEELKQVSRIGSNQTTTRCTAIQMLLAGAERDLVCNNYVCKTEEKLLERLGPAILDVINTPKKTQKTARIGTLI